ncbi:MAG: hypothetical protein CMK32_04220 [Porticoccaceae bacterium]|nr:hypothetical protein [Porticoccaceae bacterium]
MPPYLQALIAREKLPPQFSASVETVVLPLAGAIAEQWRQQGERTIILGINGAQGTGKSTLTLFLGAVLSRDYGLNIAGFSLDDLYLTRAERARLAAEIHPMFRVRGVPGTHDIAMGQTILDQLAGADGETVTRIPVFDKAIDDRKPDSDWKTVRGRPDLIIIEGWCVGAMPEPAEALTAPINKLEAERDAEGRWRRHVNRQLASVYRAFFDRIDWLLMLKAPGWEQVYHWRLLQENKLGELVKSDRSSGDNVMTPEQVRDFIQYYQRLTVHQLSEIPARADAVIDVDAGHQWRSLGGPLVDE